MWFVVCSVFARSDIFHFSNRFSSHVVQPFGDKESMNDVYEWS